MKRAWEMYDRKLEENLRLNEELLRRSNLDRVRREMGTPKVLMWVSVATTPIWTMFSLRWTIQFGGEPLYLICGCVSLLFFVWNFIVDLQGLGKIRGIEYYNSSVVALQKQVGAFEKWSYRGRKLNLTILPVILLALLMLASKGIQGIDLLDRMRSPTVIATCLVSLAAAYALTIWMWRDLFDKKTKAARRFLSELDEFEKE